MSKRSLLVLPICLLACGLLTTAGAWETPTDSFGGRLATYDKAAGESYFALSITPQVRPKAPRVQDVVVLVDTSASQRGLFRSDSLLALETLIGQLDSHDRVQLVAVDLKAVPLSDGFVSAGSKEMKQALAQLQRRAPLGCTDMVVALQAAAERFEASSTNPRAVVYIGDGLSRANLFGDPEIRTLLGQLVERQVSVSSFAIGAERNIAFLAMLANQTGGMIYLDSDAESSAQQAGVQLAKAVQLPVLWPQKVQMPAGLVEHYPVSVPPLRTDRDTILIGKLESHGPQALSMTAQFDGQSMDLAWQLVAERSNEDFAFLPVLVDQARDNGGLTLPTVGSAGLLEVARLIFAQSENVSLDQRPATPQRQAVADKFYFVSYQEEEAAPEADTGQDSSLLSELDATSQILGEVEKDRALRTARIKAEVEVALEEARRDHGRQRGCGHPEPQERVGQRCPLAGPGSGNAQLSCVNAW